MMKVLFDEKLHEECGVFGVYRRDGTWTWCRCHLLRPVRAAAPRPGELRHGRQRRRRDLHGTRTLGLVNEVFTKDVLADAAAGADVQSATAAMPPRARPPRATPSPW